MCLKRLLLLGSVLQLAMMPAMAQNEVKPVQVRNNWGEVEEYSVLATDKKVRQGAYVRYRPATFAGVVILEAGSYDHGLKTGEWQTFSENRPWNKLLSKGAYLAGLPDGLWTYYHYKFAGGGPFNSANTPVAQTTPNGSAPTAGYSVSITDTAAVVQAQGLYAQGNRVGAWLYYDHQGQVIQKIDHFSNHLLFWRPETDPAVSGAAAATHPLLYLGGKNRLREEIFRSMDINKYYDAARSGVAEFAFAVAATGQQTGITLVGPVSPTHYEKLLLAALSKVPATWLAQAVAGKLEAAEYRIRISTKAETVDGRRGVGTTVEILGN